VGRRLGQHFLFDPSILGRIADAALIEPGDVVLEVGPGKGTLTRELARRAGSGGRVIAIEKDRALAAALAQSPLAPNVTVVSGDALKVEWPPADVIAGNIPYQITSPLIERALEPPLPRRIVFLVQREVAERLAARAGEPSYGALSAGVQLTAGVERLFGVGAGAFRPAPRVESALVRITPRPGSPARTAAEEEAARRLIRAAFQRRRQQIQRTLREYAGLGQAAVEAALGAAGIEPAARPEELSPEQFVLLARNLPSA
jgi:16S rRNA (adenine1518-N6/adenine1519-N6)-dimethyltransferase